MTLSGYLADWKRRGAITAHQHDVLSALVERRRVSLHVELNALMYLGVLALAGGIGWTIAVHAERFGDAAILLALGGIFAGCLYYCFTGAPSYTNAQTEAPGILDYVLYLGCLVFAVTLGYLQGRFAFFGAHWDYALLAAAGVYFVLAYRFDNRFVLSMALSSLGAWFGVRITDFGERMDDSLRVSALAYGGVLVGVGVTLFRRGIKPHFFDAYLHVAVHAVMLALLSGVPGHGFGPLLSLLALLGAAALTFVLGARYRRFAFVAYGILYAYAGLSIRIIRDSGSVIGSLFYFVVSATLVVIAIVAMARKVGRE